MKKYLALTLPLLVCTFFSCSDDEPEVEGEFADFVVARPITMAQEDFALSVDIIEPQPIEESGKIYAYQDYIFVNDKYRGVHIIDNSDATSPNRISFLKVPGNVDISVKDDYLYADSLMDLLVFDISDIENIELVNRLDNVLTDNVAWPAAEIFEWGEVDHENEIVVGWETTVEQRRRDEVVTTDILFDGAAVAEDASGSTGQGGSLARFKIVDDYLYAVDSHNINIFDISDLEDPQDLEDVFAGFDIETIFNRDNYLFLGSMRGMYIYDISSPATPTFVSQFEHGTACDPVVVDDNYAYVTLRGGNFCGATESGLYIVDISTIEEPELKVIYPMDEPYGLGIKDDTLFVCDGASGLKVYDKSEVPNLSQINHFDNIVTFDVIPLDEQLLMVGKGTLYQYEYLNDNIRLISTLQLD